ncbi:MAG: DUF4870 domain-containing protein [Liquorilactobacillus nagelii]|jgi:uncharacterized Tic20 family protein|uniref:DUF4870 domain-containing protein n=1 Tax=Liquorilactobacillus nagelii TaxID=82688 RepID=UPI00242ADC95|nr:DUF4870 domain-containing protein [Liquorilactobacillus nagelii]MCI1921193.1 DUF4870 domain-containing protein [Liquorilactobacillus nagelii]MCI1977173.1 DUF4870 domain-containing protein [Liquorilactobacillus nagelii]
MSKNQILSALSYLSILFAPFIFPLIVWIVCRDEPIIHHHAATALWLHLIPILLCIAAIIFLGISGLITQHVQYLGAGVVIILGLILLISLFIFIYNLYRGIKLLVD